MASDTKRNPLIMNYTKCREQFLAPVAVDAGAKI